jgi:hypothetical protein
MKKVLIKINTLTFSIISLSIIIAITSLVVVITLYGQIQNQAYVYVFNRTKELETAKMIGGIGVNGALDTRSCILVQITNGTIIGTKMNENGTMEQVSDQSCGIGYAYRTPDNSPEMIKKYEDQARERVLRNSRTALYKAFGNN